MKFNYPNAFSINCLVGRAFPFSYEVETFADGFGFSIYPTQLISITDILEKYAQNFLVIFEVGHYWTNEEKGFPEIYTLAEVAEAQEVDFIEYDKETLGIEKSLLTRLLTDFGHYNLSFFAFSQKPSFEEVYESYQVCKSHNWKDRGNLLSKLHHSNLYVSSHDDCYLYLETKNLSFLKEIFVRNLQFLVMTKDFQHRLSESELESVDEIIEVKIADVPIEVMNKIFSADKSITVLQEDVVIDKKIVKIPFSNKRFDFQNEQSYSVEGFVSYDFNLNQWNIEDLPNQ